MNELVDLGVTSIAGCLTTDTSDYSQLRNFEREAIFDSIETDWTGIDDIEYVVDVDANRILFGGNEVVVDFDTNLWGYEENGAPGTFVFQDTWASSYDTDLAAFLAGIVLPDPTLRQDNISTVPDFLYEQEYAVTVVDSASSHYFDDTGDPLGRDGKVLELFSDVDSDDGYGGYVSHGPAVSSESFTVPDGRQISLDWFAAGLSDDFHVFGYLLNTDTCAQIEIIDATGEEQAWTTTSVTIPTAGSYRFVFVSGTFDQTFGLAAGALLYIDNIVQSVVFEEPGVDLALSVGIGAVLAGSTVELSGGNLAPNSNYELLLDSTSVPLATGVADGAGNFRWTITLPSSFAAGRHALTLRGIAPGGAVLTSAAYVTVGADGGLLYVSADVAQVLAAEALSRGYLAATGLEITPALLVGGGVLLAGAALTLARTRRRRAD